MGIEDINIYKYVIDVFVHRRYVVIHEVFLVVEMFLHVSLMFILFSNSEIILIIILDFLINQQHLVFLFYQMHREQEEWRLWL